MTGHVFGPSRPLLWISWNDILRIKKADLPPASAHFWPPLKALQSGVQLLPEQPAQPIPDWFPSGGKSIAIIKDDRTENFGPAAFDKHTIHRLVAAAASLIVCSGPPVKQVYAAAAFMVELGGHVVLVECQPHRHEEWIAFLDRHALWHAPLLEAVPTPGGVIMQPRSRRKGRR